AIACFGKALAKHESAALLRERGHAYAERGDWQQALDDLAKAFRIEGPAENDPAWLELAVLRLQTGDQSGYRSLCARALEMHARQHTPESLRIATSVCGLALDESKESKPLCDEILLYWQSHYEPWAGQALATAYYRAGQYANAHSQGIS